jgi:hypothetical protein
MPELLLNGNFESPDDSGVVPDDWTSDADGPLRATGVGRDDSWAGFVQRWINVFPFPFDFDYRLAQAFTQPLNKGDLKVEFWIRWGAGTGDLDVKINGATETYLASEYNDGEWYRIQTTTTPNSTTGTISFTTGFAGTGNTIWYIDEVSVVAQLYPSENGAGPLQFQRWYEDDVMGTMHPENEMERDYLRRLRWKLDVDELGRDQLQEHWVIRSEINYEDP